MAVFAKRALMYIAALFAALAFLALTVLTFHPTVRHAALSIAQGLYETQRQYAVRRFLIEPDFTVIVPRLQRQLDFVQNFGSSRSQLSTEFIETVAKVMEAANTKKDYELLSPLLERLAAIEPRAYLPRLWLAKALLETDQPGVSKQIERAVELMPSDDRGHRLALELASRRGEFAQIGRLCDQWTEAQEGGILIPDRFGWFDGQTNRKLGMIATDPDGHSEFASVNGLKFGGRQRYEFRFDGEISVSEISLLLSVFPGARMQINKIEHLGQDTWKPLDLGRMVVLPSHGFVDAQNSIIFHYRGNQKVTLLVQGLFYGRASNQLKVTGIAVDATFDKLRLISHDDCKIRAELDR